MPASTLATSWRISASFVAGFSGLSQILGPLQRAVYRREQLAAEMTVADAVVSRQAGLDQRSRRPGHRPPRGARRRGRSRRSRPAADRSRPRPPRRRARRGWSQSRSRSDRSAPNCAGRRNARAAPGRAALAHQLGQRESVGVVDRGRDQAAAAQLDGPADMDASPGRNAPSWWGSR